MIRYIVTCALMLAGCGFFKEYGDSFTTGGMVQGLACPAWEVWYNCNLNCREVPTCEKTMITSETPACGMLLCALDDDGARASAAQSLGRDDPLIQCKRGGALLTSAPSQNWTACLSPDPEPCKGLGELCDDGPECCEPLLCDPGPHDVNDPYYCCADPVIHGACKTTADCCHGWCEAGACMCSDLGGPCNTLWDCCNVDLCVGGVCSCIPTGEPCNEDAIRVECCDGDYCIGGICAPW